MSINVITLSNFTRNQTFCELKWLFGVFGHYATYRRPSSKKFFEEFRRKISSIFCFLKRFRLRKMGFLLFPVEENWFWSLMRIPSGIFWRCKIDEVLTIMSFSLGSPYDIAYLVFSSKVRNFLRKLRDTASPLCLNLSSCRRQFVSRVTAIMHPVAEFIEMKRANVRNYAFVRRVIEMKREANEC